MSTGGSGCGCWGRAGSENDGTHPANTVTDAMEVECDQVSETQVQNAMGLGQLQQQSPAVRGADPVLVHGNELQAPAVDLHPPIVIDWSTLGQSEFDLTDTFQHQDRPAPQSTLNLKLVTLGKSEVAMPGDELEPDCRA